MRRGRWPRGPARGRDPGRAVGRRRAGPLRGRRGGRDHAGVGHRVPGPGGTRPGRIWLLLPPPRAARRAAHVRQCRHDHVAHAGGGRAPAAGGRDARRRERVRAGQGGNAPGAGAAGGRLGGRAESDSERLRRKAPRAESRRTRPRRRRRGAADREGAGRGGGLPGDAQVPARGQLPGSPFSRPSLRGEEAHAGRFCVGGADAGAGERAGGGAVREARGRVRLRRRRAVRGVHPGARVPLRRDRTARRHRPRCVPPRRPRRRPRCPRGLRLAAAGPHPGHGGVRHDQSGDAHSHRRRQAEQGRQGRDGHD
mmetsp:Transcript_22992/g.49755  ORF Transcript_22992/g.49755 Transcript_22992/m.49755 type:complete len:310 (-) Transcript_22992:607-1536(-)